MQDRDEEGAARPGSGPLPPPPPVDSGAPARRTGHDSDGHPSAGHPLPGHPLPGHPLEGPATAVATRPVSRRIRGLDLARALAIIGMVMVHFRAFRIDPDLAGDALYATSHGRASILFVVLAGVGMSLLAGDRSPGRLRGTVWRLLYRAVVLLPLGLALQWLGTRVAIILQYYAIYFLVAVPALRLRDRALLGSAFATAVVGPLVHLSVWFAVPDWYDVIPQPGFREPLVLLRELLLTGYYPVAVWSAPLFFGMWLGRRDLRAPRTRRALLLGGAGVAAAAYALAWRLTLAVGAPSTGEPSWRWLAVAEPHSQMPLWIVSAVGVACAIIAVAMWVCDVAPRLTWPGVATGQLALSVYVGHLLVLWRYPQWLLREDALAASISVLRFTVVAVLLATLWRTVFRRGPLESVLHLPFR